MKIRNQIGFAVLVVLALAGCSTPTPVPTQAQTPPETAAPVDDDPSACGLEGYETESTLTAAPTATWVPLGAVAVPSDPEGAGPGDKTEAGLPTCYARTAEGALYAATNFLAVGTDANLLVNLAPLVAPGEGREAAERNDGESNPSSVGIRDQVTGFKVEQYDGSTAKIVLALNYTDGQLVSLPVQLEWADGDWKVVLNGDGKMPLPPAPLRNLDGYIAWPGA